MSEKKKYLTYRGACMTWECDSNRHMNVMYFVNKFENAGRNFTNELGLFPDGLDDKKGLVVVEMYIQYHQEVLEDDVLYVESCLLDIGNSSYRVLHEMYNGRTKQKVSEMNLVSVLFNKETRKAMPLTGDMKARMKTMLSSKEN